MKGLLRRWLCRLQRRRSLGRLYVVESMTDIPENPGADFYIVRRGDIDRRVVLSCPCRCGRRIDLSLMETDNPHWRVLRRKHTVSLMPSVWLRSDPCGSHFFVRDGKIAWVDS